MTSTTEKSLPINPITGQELGQPSQDYSCNELINNFHTVNTEKGNLLKESYLSANQREKLQKQVTEFLNIKFAQQKNQIDQYHDEFCVCPDCTYQRNLRKPSHTLFNLTMKSVYKKDFHSSKQTANSLLRLTKNIELLNAKKINQKQSSICPKEKVSFQTIYNTSMKKDNSPEKIINSKIQDSLKFEGPFEKVTTYQEKFPGVTGGNPYVKPLDKAFRQNFSLNSRTLNSTFYTGQFTERTALIKSPDNIRIGLPMLSKQTTSQKFYNPPLNPQNYNRAYKTIIKPVQTLKYKKQFESTYGKSFYGPEILQSVKQKKRLIRQTMSKLGMGQSAR